MNFLEKIKMKLKAIILDRWSFINFFIIYQLLCTIPIFYTYLSKLSKVLLLWGLLIIIFTFLSKSKLKESLLFIILLLFITWYLIVIVFYPNFSENFKMLLYFIIQIAVIFGVTKREDIIINQNKFISLIKQIIVITFAFSVFSLYMYITKFEKTFIFNNTAYNLGYTGGRLGGVYGNSNMLGIIASISFFLSMALKQTSYFYRFNGLVQLICISLSYSRGSILTMVFAAIFAVYSLVMSRYKNTWPKFLLFILCVPIIMCAYFGMNFIAQKSQVYYMHSFEPTEFIDNSKKAPENIGFESTEAYRGAQTNSARVELFVLGLKVFKHNPITGVGVMNIGNFTEPYLTESSTYTVDNPILNNPHNTPVQILASSGLIGFVIILIFAILYFKKVFFRFRQNSSSVFYTYLLALEIMLLSNSLLEWYIFLNSSVIASIFWLVSSELLIFTPHKNVERIKING